MLLPIVEESESSRLVLSFLCGKRAVSEEVVHRGERAKAFHSPRYRRMRIGTLLPCLYPDWTMAEEKSNCNYLVYGILAVLILAFVILFTVRHTDNAPTQVAPMHQQR